jgi:hypothetical protein
MNNVSFIHDISLSYFEYLVAGAVKTLPEVNAVLERARTNNALYHFLFHQTISGNCLNKGVVSKVRYSSVCSKDFVILCSVTAGPQLAEQSCAAKCQNMTMPGRVKQ